MNRPLRALDPTPVLLSRNHMGIDDLPGWEDIALARVGEGLVVVVSGCGRDVVCAAVFGGC